MKKKEVKPSAEYFRLVKTEHNMFTVEMVTITEGAVTKLHSDDPTFLPIAFDKLRRKTGEAFFAAVQNQL